MLAAEGAPVRADPLRLRVGLIQERAKDDSIGDHYDGVVFLAHPCNQAYGVTPEVINTERGI